MENVLLIKSLKIFAYHGVHSEEKINGQNFIIDAEIKTDKLRGYESDNIDDVVSYSKIIKQIISFFTAKSCNLIEKIAEDTAKYLFETFGEINEINLTVKKPEAPISANFDYVAVKISRKRSDYID